MIKDIVSFKWKDEPNVLAPQWDWEFVGNIIIKQQLLGCCTAARHCSAGILVLSAAAGTCLGIQLPRLTAPLLVDAKLCP